MGAAVQLNAQDRSEFWPELGVHVTLTDRTRFYFIAQISSDQDTHSVQGEFGPNFDFYMRTLRAKYRHTDPAKNKMLTIRVGYRYLPTLSGDDPNEKRPILEITPRFNLPWEILATDRNRFDFRFVDGKPFSWRYRNRLMFERHFFIHKFELTPYVRGEIYYDSRYDRIAKNAFTAGTILPVNKHSEFEVYYEDKRDTSSSPIFHIRGVGLILNLYF
jgi:hypothetical protein